MPARQTTPKDRAIVSASRKGFRHPNTSDQNVVRASAQGIDYIDLFLQSPTRRMRRPRPINLRTINTAL